MEPKLTLQMSQDNVSNADTDKVISNLQSTGGEPPLMWSLWGRQKVIT